MAPMGMESLGQVLEQPGFCAVPALGLEDDAVRKEESVREVLPAGLGTAF
jgi:hypothetical protein